MYQDGILRIYIDEVDGVEQRFRVADLEDFAVMNNQLTATNFYNYTLSSDEATFYTDAQL